MPKNWAWTPNRIVAGGGSAGGHISLLGTTNPALNDPNDPRGIDTSAAAYVLFNPALSKSDAKDPDVDFLQHLKADFGPAIVFFGSEDPWLKKGPSGFIVGRDPVHRSKSRSLF